MVITFKVLTPSRQDPFSRPCLGAHFFMFVATFSRTVTILSPNLDPRARVLHVTFRLFFRPGTKRGPRGDQEVPKATKKRPWGSPGVPKREPRRCPGYPKRVLGDLFRARWREGRRQLDTLNDFCETNHHLAHFGRGFHLGVLVTSKTN